MIALEMMDIQPVFKFIDNDVMLTSIILDVEMVLTRRVSLVAEELMIDMAKRLHRHCVAWQQRFASTLAALNEYGCRYARACHNTAPMMEKVCTTAGLEWVWQSLPSGFCSFMLLWVRSQGQVPRVGTTRRPQCVGEASFFVFFKMALTCG